MLSAAALLAACSGNSNPTPAATHVTHVSKPAAPKAKATPAELTAGMVEAVTVGKSTVPVALKFDVTAHPLVGKPLDVIVAVMPQIAADAAVLTVTDSGSLTLPTGSGPAEIPAVDPTEVYRQAVTVTPTAEGVQLLALSVSLKHDEITETRLFSVPIIVTSGAGAAGN